MSDFQALLGETEMAREIVDLWQEYEDGQTAEAQFVKDLDKFEMIVQALEYEKCKDQHILNNSILLNVIYPFSQLIRKSSSHSLIQLVVNSGILQS